MSATLCQCGHSHWPELRAAKLEKIDYFVTLCPALLHPHVKALIKQAYGCEPIKPSDLLAVLPAKGGVQ